MHDKFVNSEKLLVVFQSAKKNKINIKNKKNWITFVGKLNKSMCLLRVSAGSIGNDWRT